MMDKSNFEAFGQGCTTGHQNSRPLTRKVACSTMCHAPDRSPSENAAGMCQIIKAAVAVSQQNLGRASILPSRCTGDQLNRDPNCTTWLGSPCSIGTTGAPNQISGGASVMSSRC